MNKNIRKTSAALSLLVYSHLLCFLLTSEAHSHHHHNHHHHHDHSNSNTDVGARNRSGSRGNGDGGTRNHAAGGYPSATGWRKERKISSRTTNGQVDTRHSAVPSTYFKNQNEDATGMKRKTRESEEEFGWRQNENEMSDQAFLEKSKDMLESFGPLAVTNLALKSLHSTGINKDWDHPDRMGSKGLAIPAVTPRANVCSLQQFEILKGELFQYDIGKLMNHIKLMTSVSNEAVADDTTADVVGRDVDAPSWSDSMMARSTATPNMEGGQPEADKVLHYIFSLLDENHDNVLEYIELYKAEVENRLETPQGPCQLRDFLLYHDSDHSGQLDVTEFFSSFIHFYDITMIQLDKEMERKKIQALEGNTVVLTCDIKGSPVPYIHFRRYEADVSQMASLGMKSSIDGTLSLTNVHMVHAGEFSCYCPRNPEVVQTHILHVETQPYVLITPKVSWKRPGEDLLLICRLVLPVIDSSSEKEIATGFSDEVVVNWTWLLNGIQLPKSDKYIFENTTRMSRLRIREIYFQDMGSYSCQAENSGGIGSDTASLVIIDPNSKAEMQALHNMNARQLLVFHQNGVASYSADCQWLWELFGDDSLPKEKDLAPAVCDQFHGFCDWGEAIQVSPYVYAAQPSLNRVLLIHSVGNVLGIIPTCRNPGRMEFVPYTDQLWIRCEEDNGQTLFTIIENASKGDSNQKTIQFPLQQQQRDDGPVRVEDIFLPSHQEIHRERRNKDCQFGYVSFSNEQFLRRLDLKSFTYQKYPILNLTKFSCIPHQIHFSLSCSTSVVSCYDPQTKLPNGQLVLDTLSNSVRSNRSEINGVQTISPDNRILLTEKHVGNNTHLFVQRIGAFEIHLQNHFILSNKLLSTFRVLHSYAMPRNLVETYAAVAKLPTGEEVILSLEKGEILPVDEADIKVPHNHPTEGNTFPIKTGKSIFVFDADTLRPRCKFYEDIPELQSFLTVQT